MEVALSFDIFHITDENPNQRVGGGGCLCSPTACGDGPYMVFNGTDMESPVSPFPVACAGCVRRGVEVMDGKAAELESL
jgi:hypothetical protein